MDRELALKVAAAMAVAAFAVGLLGRIAMLGAEERSAACAAWNFNARRCGYCDDVMSRRPFACKMEAK